MTEYTAAVIVGLILVLTLDHALKTRVLRFSNRSFWMTTGVFFVFQLVFDNLFTAQGLWIFNRTETLGVFVPFIPIENLLFGFELLALTIILYEFFARSRTN